MALNSKPLLRSEEGQATSEYIVLMAVVVSFYMAISATLSKLGIGQRITAAVMGPFAAAYQFGHPKAQGFDNGGPKLHPRVDSSGNFRIFIQPEAK